MWNYRTFGLESPEERFALSLGEPIPTFTVPYDGLLHFRPGTDPASRLTVSDKFSYPLMVKGQVRSALLLSKANGRWRVVGSGSAKMAKKFDRLVKASAALTKLPLSEYSDVQIPIFSLYFVGYRLNNRLFLIPLYDEPSLNLWEGQAQPADELFTALAAYARAIDLWYGSDT